MKMMSLPESFWALQWSHGPLAMETPGRFPLPTGRSPPSMEPWPFSHGNELQQGFRQRPVSHLQWSHGPLAMETRRRRTTRRLVQTLQWSHGPLAMETGISVVAAAARRSLQWSHGPLAMETARRWTRCSAASALQWSHGPLAMETWQARYQLIPTGCSFNGAMAL